MNALKQKLFKTGVDKAPHQRILQRLSASERRDFEVGPHDLPFRSQPARDVMAVTR